MSQTLVGKLNKAFGIKGFIKVVPQKAFKSDMVKSDVWFVKRGNDTIPYFVESTMDDPHFLVKFEEVDSPEDARKITGCDILLRDKDISIHTDQVEDDLNKLVGFTVVDKEIELGVITRIEEYPQQLMAFMIHANVEIMMPLAPEYILDLNIEEREITVDLPSGFIESQF